MWLLPHDYNLTRFIKNNACHINENIYRMFYCVHIYKEFFKNWIDKKLFNISGDIWKLKWKISIRNGQAL